MLSAIPTSRVMFDGEMIAQNTGGNLLRNAGLGPIWTDTRTLPEGAWFLALVGDRFNGHEFVDRALRAGCAGVVVSQNVVIPDSIGVVQVTDTTQALQQLASFVRREYAGPVVGITGSSGKTTTRALIALGLSPLGEVWQTPGNLNNHLGVPMTFLGLWDEAAAVVVELGTSSPGEIRLLAQISQPNVRLVTNVGPSHLEDLGGLEGVAKEKGALFEMAGPNDTLCVNLDDPFVSAMPKALGANIMTYGVHSSAQVRLLSTTVQPEKGMTGFSVEVEGVEYDGVIPLVGHHMAHNAVAALSVAHALGVDPEASLQGMERYEAVGMRMREETVGDKIKVLNDSYNANPDSMRASLIALSAYQGRKIAVLGDMLELGESELKWHEDIAHFVGELDLDLTVFLGPRMAMGARALGESEHVWIRQDAHEIGAQLASILVSGDVLLLKGSRGSQVEQVLAEIRKTFSMTLEGGD